MIGDDEMKHGGGGTNRSGYANDAYATGYKY